MVVTKQNICVLHRPHDILVWRLTGDSQSRKKRLSHYVVKGIGNCPNIERVYYIPTVLANNSARVVLIMSTEKHTVYA